MEIATPPLIGAGASTDGRRVRSDVARAVRRRIEALDHIDQADTISMKTAMCRLGDSRNSTSIAMNQDIEPDVVEEPRMPIRVPSRLDADSRIENARRISSGVTFQSLRRDQVMVATCRSSSKWRQTRIML